jgi:hypothetical protein
MPYHLQAVVPARYGAGLARICRDGLEEDHRFHRDVERIHAREQGSDEFVVVTNLGERFGTPRPTAGPPSRVHRGRNHDSTLVYREALRTSPKEESPGGGWGAV